ncbi:MAG: hypothetical protein Q9191_001403, partial [Dirinaria sp. TL-2023a]
MEALRNSILGGRKSDENSKSSVLKKDAPSMPSSSSAPNPGKSRSPSNVSLPSIFHSNSGNGSNSNNNTNKSDKHQQQQQQHPNITEAETTAGAKTVQKANSIGSTRSTATKSILKSPSNASDRSVKSAASSSGKSVAIVAGAGGNDDPLPTDIVGLEGRLNHHTSQLQHLADRVERINEWIDMDSIVLQRLIRDSEVVAEAQADLQEVTQGLQNTTISNAGTSNNNNGTKTNTTTNNSTHIGIPHLSIPFTTIGGSSKTAPTDPGKKPTPTQPAPTTQAILEARDRISTMRRWKKDLERTVIWQREEYRRVERAMGRTGGKSKRFRITNADMGLDEAEVEEGGSSKSAESITPPADEVAETTTVTTVVGAYARGRWGKGGTVTRLPSQGQWEEMFGNGGGGAH